MRNSLLVLTLLSALLLGSCTTVRLKNPQYEKTLAYVVDDAILYFNGQDVINTVEGEARHDSILQQGDAGFYEEFNQWRNQEGYDTLTVVSGDSFGGFEWVFPLMMEHRIKQGELTIYDVVLNEQVETIRIRKRKSTLCSHYDVYNKDTGNQLLSYIGKCKGIEPGAQW